MTAVHISDIARAEIAARDWERLHIASDKRAAIELPDRKRVKVSGLEKWR